MVVLTTAAFIVAIGFVAWILGTLFDYAGIAAIGCMFVLGAGAMATAGGVVYASGETVQSDSTETTVSLDDIGEATHVVTKDVSGQDSSPTGIDFSADGSMLYMSGASSASIYAYDSGDHDLSIATLSSSYDVSSEDSTPVGVEVSPDGSKMFVTGDANDAIFQYDLATDYDITTASPNGNLSVGGHISSPRASDFDGEGDTLYVVGGGGVIHSYTLATPYDVTTATHADDFDVSAQESTPTAIDFSVDGSKMLLVGEDQDVIFQYTLDTPYDITTASYSGNRLDISTQVNRAAGLAYEKDGKKTFVADRQGSTLEQYDSAATTTNTVTTKETTYEEVDTPQQFSIGLLLMLLGGVGILRVLEGAGG